MPAPLAPVIYASVIGQMGPTTTGSPAFQTYLAALTTHISTQWEAWITASSWGGLTIVTSVGAGGEITAPPFTISAATVCQLAGFNNPTAAQLKFLNALATVLTPQFGTWASSFVFAGVTYSGVNTPEPLASLGVGTPPSGIESAWEAILTAAPDPIFQLSNPLVYTKLFTAAVSNTIQTLFTSVFLATTIGSGNTGGVSGISGTNGIFT